MKFILNWDIWTSSISSLFTSISNLLYWFNPTVNFSFGILILRTFLFKFEIKIILLRFIGKSILYIIFSFLHKENSTCVKYIFPFLYFMKILWSKFKGDSAFKSKEDNSSFVYSFIIISFLWFLSLVYSSSFIHSIYNFKLFNLIFSFERFVFNWKSYWTKSRIFFSWASSPSFNL